MQDLNLIAISQDLNNWLPVTEIPKHYPQFNYPTLKAMFWKRAEKPGLERCCRIVGKRMFVNSKLFGLWMAGGLPEQHATLTIPSYERGVARLLRYDRHP